MLDSGRHFRQKKPPGAVHSGKTIAGLLKCGLPEPDLDTLG
jgi:hypothetical protein